MKRTLILLLLILPFAGSQTFAQKQLKDFDALMDALNGGAIVRMTIHYGECTLIVDGKEEDKSVNAVGGMSLDVYEYFAKGVVYNKQAFVVASKTKLIANPLGDGFTYNYAKVKVYADGTVKLLAQYVDPKTFEVTMNETFVTTMNQGKTEGAAYFYRN